MEKVNINKLKEYWHNDTPVIVTKNVVTIQKKSRLKWDFHCNAKPKGLPWINSKPRPNKPSLLLWTSNNCTDEIKWLPSGKPRFKENMPRKCKINSRNKHYNKLKTTKQLYTKQLYSHKYVLTTTYYKCGKKISRKYG